MDWNEFARSFVMLLCGIVLSTKAVFLHRFFSAWREQKMVGIEKPFQLTLFDAIIYHAAVSTIVLGIIVGQMYALSRNYAVTPALAIIVFGLCTLEVAISRGAKNLLENHP